MERAWEPVRANKGAAGIDEQSIADVEQYGVSRLLDRVGRGSEGRQLASIASAPGIHPEARPREEQRPLSIPAVRDRVVQAAMKIVIEPIFEADMLACSFGFRPKRSAARRAPGLIDESWEAGGGFLSRTSLTVSRRFRTRG